MGLRGTRRKARFKRDTVRQEGPLLLVCDTSSAYLNVALQRGQDLLAAHCAYQPLSHAKALLPAIELVLAEQGFKLENVDVFGICLGPGSFTGLRVSMATVKALAFGTEKPAVGIPTIDILAASVRCELPVGCLIDARKGEAYSALFSAPGADGQRQPLLAVEAGTPEVGVARILGGAEGPVHLVGSGCLSAPEELFVEPRLQVADSRWHLPDVRTLARLCMDRFERGETTTVEHLEPVYIGRPPIHKHRG